MQVVKLNETVPANAAKDGKKEIPALSETYFNNGFNQPEVGIPNLFFAAQFCPLASGPVTEWPKIPYGGMLPESVNNALDKAGEKISNGAEAVAGVVLRGVQNTTDFVCDLVSGDELKVKLVREGEADKPGIFTRAKTTVTGWFSKAEKKDAEKPSLTVVKTDKSIAAATEQAAPAPAVDLEAVDKAISVASAATLRIIALGEEKANAFGKAGDEIVAKHNGNREAARPEIEAFLAKFLKDEVKMNDAEITEAIAAMTLVSNTEVDHVELTTKMVETVRTNDEVALAMAVAYPSVAAASQEAVVQAAADLTQHAVTALTAGVATLMVDAITQPAAEASMSETLNEQFTVKFIERFDAIRQSMAFDPAWLGDDGGLEGMYESDEVRKLLSVGYQVKCVDSKGRKIIATGTAVGPVIVYEAVAGGHQLCFQAPQPLKRANLIRSTGQFLNGDEVEMVVGSADGKKVVNVGKAMGMLFTHANHA
jgi:hypothetical protein